MVGGTLPPGLTLHDDGVVNGTPTAAGSFNFTLRATDGNLTRTATVTKRVTASPVSPNIVVEKQGSRAVPGRTQLYVIRVRNTGAAVARNVTVDEFLQPWFTYVDSSPEPRAVDTYVTFNATRFAAAQNVRRSAVRTTTRTTVTWTVPRLAPGESALITYQARLSPRIGTLQDEFGTRLVVSGEACARPSPPEPSEQNRTRPKRDKTDCGEQFKRCKERVKRGCDIPADLATFSSVVGGCAANPIACGWALAGATGLVDTEDVDDDPVATVDGNIRRLCETLGNQAVCKREYEACRVGDRRDRRRPRTEAGRPAPAPDCDVDDKRVRGPVDPNEKIVGAERFVQPGQRLPYVVRFENVGTAPARNVTVTDRLPPELDPSSVRVYAANRTRRSLQPGQTVTLLRQNRTRSRVVKIGNATVVRNETVTQRHTATLNRTNRTVRWRLENIDLQPNATGRLLLSVAVERNLSDGTRIENDATIRFDEVSSLTTNETVNVVDTATPRCEVAPLPARSRGNVSLSWSGSDPVGQIEEVTILQSTDGETWTVAAESVDRSTVTVGTEPGETYRFVCVAQDTAGNEETQLPTAEATTTVAADDADTVGSPSVATPGDGTGPENDDDDTTPAGTPTTPTTTTPTTATPTTPTSVGTPSEAGGRTTTVAPTPRPTATDADVGTPSGEGEPAGIDPVPLIVTGAVAAALALAFVLRSR